VNQREIFADKKIPDKSLEYNDEAEESRAYKIVAYTDSSNKLVADLVLFYQ
jgi:hypothetical protein